MAQRDAISDDSMMIQVPADLSNFSRDDFTRQ
jgi:hypothetical protein